MASAVVIAPMIAGNFNSESAVAGSVLAPATGGFAEWQSIASAINHSGTLTLPQALAYAAGGVYNVLAYGATGNGTTDDTAGIQAAIDAAKTNGGIVLFPALTYKTTAALDVCNTSNVVLLGAGHAGTIIECHNSDGAAIEIIGSNQIRLEDLRITGHSTNTPAVGIWTGRSTAAGGVNTSQIVFNRVSVYGYWTTACWYITGCESNHFYQCLTYAEGGGCLAGVMFDQHNTAGTNNPANGLTPEHTTLDDTYDTTLTQINLSFLICPATVTTFSPIYIVGGIGPIVRNSYLVSYGAPIAYVNGGTTDFSLEDLAIEGTPTHILYIANNATYTNNVVRMNMARLPTPGSTSGYDVYVEDDVILRNCVWENVTFAGDVRIHKAEACRFEGITSFNATNTVDFEVATGGWMLNCYLYVGWNDTFTANNAALWGTIIDKGFDDTPGTKGQTTWCDGGIALGGAPGATGQGVIRKTRYASKTWSPPEIADGAAASTYVDCSGVDVNGKWFCMASYAGIASADEWILTAYAGYGTVNVALHNKTGGAVTPTGTLAVTAWQIEASA